MPTVVALSLQILAGTDCASNLSLKIETLVIVHYLCTSVSCEFPVC